MLYSVHFENLNVSKLYIVRIAFFFLFFKKKKSYICRFSALKTLNSVQVGPEEEKAARPFVLHCSRIS